MREMLLILNILLTFKFIYCSLNSTEDESIDFNGLHIIDSSNNSYHEYHSISLTSVKFLLYLPDEVDPTEITSNNTHLLNTTQPTKVLIPGLGTFHDHVWVDQMVTRYHSKGDYNLIVVDWSQVSTFDGIYIVPAVNSVGEVVGNFLVEVTEQNVEFLENVHLIGSSVGAQVGAVAGKTVDQSGKGKIDRITGLDPSNPTNLGLLSSDDAIFVDVLHSSYAEDIFDIGTVDFFLIPDDGRDDDDDEDHDKVISEPKVEDIFILSINGDGEYMAIFCDNVTSYLDNLCGNNTKIIVGESVPRNISGTFYITKGASTAILAQKHNNALILTGLTAAFSYFIFH